MSTKNFSIVQASDLVPGMHVLCNRPVSSYAFPEDEDVEEGMFPVAGVLTTPSTVCRIKHADLNHTKQFMDIILDNEDSFSVRLSVHEMCLCVRTGEIDMLDDTSEIL